MPTFCRHNRFIERCPICSKTLPGQSEQRRGGAGRRPTGGQRAAATGRSASSGAARRPRATDVKVYVDGRRRGIDDGYSCELVPGLRSSLDARRLAEEIGFGAGWMHALSTQPPGAYGLAAELARRGDLERASWLCFLIAYLSPLEGEDPFASIAKAPPLGDPAALQDAEIEELQLGPRTCHQPGRGAATLRAYLAWAQRAGSQAQALGGEPLWSPERRFERVFERLSIPGFPRLGRYELLVVLGALSIYEISASSLQLAAAPASRAAGGTVKSATAGGAEVGDPVLAAAKRVFGIGDVLLLERRGKQLAEEIGVSVAVVELGLFNWFSTERATLGLLGQPTDADAFARAELALGL